MPAVYPAALLHHLRRLTGGAGGEPTDRDLLCRYAARRDADAFAALVRRHGPMVWRACRRLLRQEQDAEDVYQATFLVLARKAAATGWQESVAGWLYAVATRLARKARSQAARHPAAIGAGAETADPLEAMSGRELLTALDEELAALPEKYRTPLLLCSLEGQTQEEAARQLRCSLSTVRRRLEGGRGLLHARLARRGFALSAAAGALLLARSLAPAAVAPPPRVAAPAARAVALAEWFLRGVPAIPWRLAGACVLVAGLLAGGVGLVAHRDATPAAPPEQAAPPPRADDKGPPAAAPLDPLPEGALTRAGTIRFRHGSVVTSLSYSRDGKVLASGGWDAKVRVWEAATGKEIQTISLPNRVLSVALSPDGKTVASGGTDMVLRLHDVATGKQVWANTDHGSPINSVAFSPDGKRLATAAVESSVGVWDAATGKGTLFIGHEGEVRCVAFSPDSKLLASGGVDGTVRLWDPAAPKISAEQAKLTGHEGGVLSIAFSADGKSLASGGVDKIIRLWDVAGRKETLSLKGHSGSVTSVAFAPDGKTLASASGVPTADRSARLWDVTTGKELYRVRSEYLGTVLFAPDGKVLAHAPGDAGIRLLDPATGKDLPQSSGPMLRALGLAASPDGKLVAVAGLDIFLLDAATGREVRRLGGPILGSYAVAFAPDGRTLATGGRDALVRLWDVATGKEVRVMDGHKGQKPGEGWIACVAFSPDGKTLAEASRDGTVGLWDPATGKEERRLTGHAGRVWSVAWSPDGKTLATGGADRTVRLWDAATGKELSKLEGHEIDVEAVAWSPDGRLLASGDYRGKLRVWAAATGRALHVLDEQPGWRFRLNSHHDGRTLAFSPDGRLIAAGNWEAVQVWEATTGRERVRFVGHRGEVNALAFCPDGRTLVTGGFDGAALFWDVTGRRRNGRLVKEELSAPELETEWAALRGEDAIKAHRAVGRLAGDPKQALPLLKGQLKPVPAADEKQVARLIAQLDDDSFEVRERATEELARLPGAEPALNKALEGMPSAEVRERARHALEAREKAESSAEWVVSLRALEVLEQLGTSEARDWLRELARGEPRARLTQEARAALRRLGAP
jgi:RNA polymerase sigma factor (sigma-70 family)